MGMSACSGETFSLWTWRTSCDTFLGRVYGCTGHQVAVAQLWHTRVRRVGAGRAAPARSCPGGLRQPRCGGPFSSVAPFYQPRRVLG